MIIVVEIRTSKSACEQLIRHEVTVCSVLVAFSVGDITVC